MNEKPAYAQAEYAQRPGDATDYYASGDHPVLATARPELVQPAFGGPQAYPTAGAHGLHGGDMHGQILPIYNTGGGGGGHFRSEEHQQLVLTAYALARGVKILALISCFFVMLNFLLSGALIFLMLFLGPLIGYYGAKSYNANQIYCYLAYYFVDIAVLIWGMTEGATYLIVFVLIDLFIMRYVYMLCVLIKGLDPNDLEFLRNAHTMPEVTGQRSFYYF